MSGTQLESKHKSKSGADPGRGGTSSSAPPPGPIKNGENVGNNGEKRRKKGQSGRGRKENDKTEK